MAKNAKIIRKYQDFSIIFAIKNTFLSKFLPKSLHFPSHPTHARLKDYLPVLWTGSCLDVSSLRSDPSVSALMSQP